MKKITIFSLLMGAGSLVGSFLIVDSPKLEPRSVETNSSQANASRSLAAEVINRRLPQQERAKQQRKASRKVSIATPSIRIAEINAPASRALPLEQGLNEHRKNRVFADVSSRDGIGKRKSISQKSPFIQKQNQRLAAKSNLPVATLPKLPSAKDTKPTAAARVASEKATSSTSTKDLAPLPLAVVLSQADPALIPLTESQRQIVTSATEQFIQEVGAENQIANDPLYFERFTQSQISNDEHLRSQIGWRAYNQFQLATVQASNSGNP